MAAPVPARGAQKAHYTVPQCLLRLRDRVDAHLKLDGEGLQLWLDYELEALRYGVDPDICCENLVALIEDSTLALLHEGHGAGQKAIWYVGA